MADDKNKKLVNLGGLEKVAQNLKTAAKNAVDAEKERALAAEEAIDVKANANAAAIAAINNEETGLLKQAKDHAQGLVDGEKGLREQADTALDTRLKTLEGIVSGNAEVTLGDIIEDVAENAKAIAKLNGAADEEGSVAKTVAEAVAAEATLRDNADKALDVRVKANEEFIDAQPAKDEAQNARIEALENANKEDGDVAKAIKAAQTAAEQAQSEVDLVEGRALVLEGRADDLEEDVARLDGDVNTEGSVKKQIKDAIDIVNDAAEALEARVAANENSINAMDAEMGVPAEGENAATGMYKVIADGDAKALEDAKKYADEKITALVDSAPDAMNTLNELAQAIGTNKSVYDAYVEQHAQAMAQQKTDLQKEIDDDVKALEDAQKETNEDFEARIAANENFVKAQTGVDKTQDDRLDALEAKFEGDESVAGQIAGALQAAKDYADDKAEEVQGNVDALEAVVGREAEGESAATGIFAKLAEMQADINQNESDCDKAIADEATARNQAITDALQAYSNTEAVKLMLGNVVSTLNLSIDNDQVILKLGGQEGIELTSTSLNIATDDEINTMLNSLQ